jgi:hypothetical protein
MKNKIFTFGICAIVIALSSTKTIAQESYPKFGLGIQANFPAGGLSAKADLTEQHTAQAVVGIFGPFSSYFGRYSYNFLEKETNIEINYKPYVYGQAGYYVYDLENYYGIDLGLDKEKSFGFGVGAGLEWCYAPFSKDLKFNMEIGYSKVDFDYYKFKSISFGAGIHYYFNL